MSRMSLGWAAAACGFAALRLAQGCGGQLAIEPEDAAAPIEDAAAAEADPCATATPDEACAKAECRDRMVHDCRLNPIVEWWCSLDERLRQCNYYTGERGECTASEDCVLLDMKSCVPNAPGGSHGGQASFCWPKAQDAGAGQ
jgi:hypothetical protein